MQLLVDYEKEYVKKLYKKMILGISIYEWENYNNFILKLQIIIKDNMNVIIKNQKIIQESLKRWSNYQINLKLWKYLNTINKKQILKIKNIREQTINDHYAQLKIFKKG